HFAALPVGAGVANRRDLLRLGDIPYFRVALAVLGIAEEHDRERAVRRGVERRGAGPHLRRERLAAVAGAHLEIGIRRLDAVRLRGRGRRSVEVRERAAREIEREALIDDGADAVLHALTVAARVRDRRVLLG